MRGPDLVCKGMQADFMNPNPKHLNSNRRRTVEKSKKGGVTVAVETTAGWSGVTPRNHRRLIERNQLI